MAVTEIKLQKPYPAQQKLIDNKKRGNLLILARRWGKTSLVSRLLFHGALTKPGFRGAFSCPTWKLMIQAFEECKNTLEPAITRVTREDRRIELYNGSLIEFWSSDDSQSGRGRKYHLWAADEIQRDRNLAKFIKGSVRPCLADYRGDLWCLGTANGEGSDLHEFYLECKQDPESWQVAHGSLEENPFIAREEIAQMRRDLGPELAAQELDSQWVRIDGVTPLVRKITWEALYREEINRTQQRVLSLDGSISGDFTALLGVWRDPFTDHYYTDYGDIVLFEPEFDGEIDYNKVENRIVEMFNSGRYSLLVYDPYQTVALVQRLKRRGIKTLEHSQNAMRLKADSHLRQLINEGRYHHPNHDLLTEHALNATLKFQSGDVNQVRMVKSRKDVKIDLAVALSMACWGLHTTAPSSVQSYSPQVASNGALASPRPTSALPFSTQFSSAQILAQLLSANPWNK